MLRFIKAKSGYIFRGTIAALAIISAFYIVATACGYKKVLIKTASAVNSTPENIKSPVLASKTAFQMTKPGTVLNNINYRGSNIAVTGKIEGKTFPVKIDTGLGFADACISSNLIRLLNLDFGPSMAIWPGTSGGICYIDSLKIGTISILNPKTAYLDQYWEKQLFGIGFDQEYQLTLGLPILEQFSYIMFDTRTGAVRFARDKNFVPYGNSWQRYQMRISPDIHNQRRLMVNIPINGFDTELMFDTCGGETIIITQNQFNVLKKSIGKYNQKQSTVTFAQFGLTHCKKVKVETLKIGSEIFYDIDLIVLPDTIQHSQNILPISVFAGKVVIVDFANSFLWIH